MALSRSGAARLCGALAVVACLAPAGPAFGADHRVVKMQDDCEPASFNAVLGPGACVRDGDTTFGELLEQFAATRAVDGWRFSRTDFKIDAGGTIEVVNEGGELHSFTRVQHFGNGCSPLDNGQPPAVDDCTPFLPPAFSDPSFVPAGEAKPFAVGGPGVALYQCMIHPWMRATAEIEGNDDDHGGKGGDGHSGKG